MNYSSNLKNTRWQITALTNSAVTNTVVTITAVATNYSCNLKFYRVKILGSKQANPSSQLGRASDFGPLTSF